MTDQQQTALVIGASGGLGQAVLQRFIDDPQLHSVIAVSRSKPESVPDGVTWITCSNSDKAIRRVVARISQRLDELALSLRYVVICSGILHGDHCAPEKKIEELSGDALSEIFSVNAFLPLQWLAALTPRISVAPNPVIAVFSARVGSIGDNRLGGWYSYRASKAALNMLLKTLAVEYARRAKGAKLIAFHPGTTDTELSRPFQANVPEAKLFEPGFVADRLHGLMASAEPDGELAYLDWEGQPIEW